MSATPPSEVGSKGLLGRVRLLLAPASDVPLEVLRGPAVIAWFQDPFCRAAAARLYARCPWATAGQRPEFLRIWLEHYGAKADPWLVLARAPDGELTGLLPLARTGDVLEYAGAFDCEYWVWLARPETSDAFIEAALTRVHREAHLPIQLLCMPPNTPVGWARRPSRLRPYLELVEDKRLVIPLSDPAQVARWVKDRSRLRTAWNKLARTGKVVFRRVRDVAEIDQVLTRWGPMYDVRKGAAYGLTPFRDDPVRRPFTLDLAAVPDLLHVTVLERDGELLAAHVAIAGTRELSLMGVAHSEFESKLSPGSLLLFELVQLAAREGFEILDLTPGTDSYKARFASDEEPVYGVTVHGSLLAAGKRVARAELRKAKQRAQTLLAARAEAAPDGWAARARPWLDRLGRQPEEDPKPPRLTAAATISMEGLLPDAPHAPVPDWRRNDLHDIVRCRAPRDAFLALLRELTTAVRAGGELYTRITGDDLSMAALLLPAAAIDNTGASGNTHVLYLAHLDRAPLREQARALLALARALPAAQRAHLRISTSAPSQATLLALLSAESDLLRHPPAPPPSDPRPPTRSDPLAPPSDPLHSPLPGPPGRAPG